MAKPSSSCSEIALATLGSYQVLNNPLRTINDQLANSDHLAENSCAVPVAYFARTIFGPRSSQHGSHPAVAAKVLRKAVHCNQQHTEFGTCMNICDLERPVPMISTSRFIEVLEISGASWFRSKVVQEKKSAMKYHSNLFG